MGLFSFLFPKHENNGDSVKRTSGVIQGVYPDGRGWTDPDSLIRSEGAKRHFEDIDRIWREQQRRLEAQKSR